MKRKMGSTTFVKRVWMNLKFGGRFSREKGEEMGLRKFQICLGRKNGVKRCKDGLYSKLTRRPKIAKKAGCTGNGKYAVPVHVYRYKKRRRKSYTGIDFDR